MVFVNQTQTGIVATDYDSYNGQNVSAYATSDGRIFANGQQSVLNRPGTITSIDAIYPNEIRFMVTTVPAAVWLLGSALAGLGWIRRKQTA